MQKERATLWPKLYMLLLQKHKQSAKETCRHETNQVEDFLEEHNGEIYVDDSDDDLDHFRSEHMDKDEELRALMEFVFGDSSDEEAL